MLPIVPMLVKAAIIEGIKSLSGNSEKEHEEIADVIIEKIIPKDVQKALEKAVDLRPFWKRKTFWSLVTGVAIPILNRVFNWNLNVEEMMLSVSTLVTFIATEQWRKK